MQSVYTKECSPREDLGDSPELRVLSPKEAFGRSLKALEVRAGTDMTFSPYEPEFSDYFARVEVKNFKDLQMLGFVPHGLAEDKVRHAIADDDLEAYKVAHTRLATGYSQPGGCECQHTETSNAPSINLRQQYEAVRKSHNPALSRVISEGLQTRVDWDSPVTGIVRNWMRYVELPQRSAISVALVSDITIDRGATLRVDKSTKSLLAGTIWIHRTGRLIYDGGYLKIWAHAITNFLNISISVTARQDIPWLVYAA